MTDVLIGYDPRHHGADALALGDMLAGALGARPLIVSTMPWANQLDDVQTQDAEVAAALAAKLEEAKERLGELGAEAKTVVSGSPALVLNDLAEADPGIAMIVLGSSHRGIIGRTLLGGVGQSLMHGAPCPVAIAPAGYGRRHANTLRNIGVAFDGSGEALAALEAAVELAERTGAQLAVIAVADFPVYGYSSAWTMVTAARAERSDDAEQEHWLETARHRIPEGIGRDEILLSGSAGNELADVSGAFDLLVTGSRAYGPLRRTLLGSTTRKLIENAACPVLVMPRGSRRPLAGTGGETDANTAELVHP